MSRASSPDTHWDHLETWLGVMTNLFLPDMAGDLQHLSREQLDEDLNRLMTHDPMQSYSHKEWAKLIGGLAHNLIAQARLNERSNALLEQEIAALKLQAEEARRNQAQTQHHLDQLLHETPGQRGTAEESDPELQEEVERLQKALEELHLETGRRERMEKQFREELTGKLQHGEALLARAEIELKERDAKARACENHLKQARSEITALRQQRDYLKDEVDTVHRELKHSYKLQSELGGDSHPACETQESAARLIANLTADTTTEEPLPRFESKGQQSQKDANALKNDADCQKLLQVLNKFKVTFAKDLLDCDRTKLHQVHSATHPNAPPTFVRQYKTSGTTAAPSHRRLHGINHMLRVKLNMLKYAPDDLTTPKLVMSQGQKGGELIYAHDTSCAKHHGTRTTDETLKQVAHWPSMQQDVAEYVRGCQVCCQVQTANANHRAPLQHRGVTFPWSVNQKDWTVQFPLMLMANTDTMQEPTRVSPTELVTAWQVTLPLHLYQPGDSSLITAYSTHQHLNKLRLQLREQLATQSQTLQTICKYWKGIVVVPCTHSFLLIQTVNSMKQLFTVFQNDFAQNQLVMALMTDLLREVSFSMDRVAMNRIPQYPMQTVLDFATGRPTRTVPAHLANSLGAAILLHVDPKQNEVAVLLNLPSGEPDNISRPKDKFNVRWWQCNTHAKKHTSDVIAYHNSNPRLCLAPHFCRCSVTKDFQYFCPNQLFLKNHTEGMGWLLLMISDTRCPAEAKPRTQVIGTQAKIVGDRLLVHTPTHAATLTYNQYNTTTRVSLPNPSTWIQVPLGPILHLNRLVAYCLSSEEYQSKLEIPSSSRNHHHTLDPGLELRIDKGGSQLSDSTPIDAALHALSRLPVLTSSPIAQAWTAANTALCLSMAIGYALTLGLAFILFKKMKGMRESMDKCLLALPRGFKRKPRRGGPKTENVPNLIEMDSPSEDPKAEDQ
ncbi:Gypsy retrotransposon integrase-like protein 1 [Anabarilius grahami]|uniref:Gypsy retrotransposon integrase-like protein 1 n=1 Tax=Anabarilius grahami TaxID=495550 RepID=A0A3N0XTZ2_ANAGA|nr:Gypsy retrotransposon integrase-like protein 1 [Anabarilius grahami]